jgi:hypothetical protein
MGVCDIFSEGETMRIESAPRLALLWHVQRHHRGDAVTSLEACEAVVCRGIEV